MSPQSSGDDYRGVARRKIFSGMAGRSYIKCEKGCELSSQPFVSGKTGIRTLGTRKGTTVFETAPIDHSGIFP